MRERGILLLNTAFTRSTAPRNAPRFTLDLNKPAVMITLSIVVGLIGGVITYWAQGVLPPWLSLWADATATAPYPYPSAFTTAITGTPLVRRARRRFEVTAPDSTCRAGVTMGGARTVMHSRLVAACTAVIDPEMQPPHPSG